MVKVAIRHGGMVRTVDESEWQATMDEMVLLFGPWNPATSSVTRVETPDAVTPPDVQPKAPVFSDFGDGKQVVDESARERIEGLHDELRAAGVKGLEKKADGKAGGQLYATGTRMAKVGYDTQAERAREHENKRDASDAAAELIEMVRAERRRDVAIDAGTFGKRLAINGALTFEGFKVREQAVRGLLARLGSPALTYVLGLRSRMTADDSTPDTRKADRDEMLHVLQNECARFCDVPLVLRTRDGIGDVFATVSPSYTAADVPDVLPDVLAALPKGAKATFAYDPKSTTWEFRASVFTPTPVDMQAVGEPFEGFLSFGSRDNGTRSLDSGGGILVLACLNAGIYTADSQGVTRRHVGRILVDLHAMAENATAAIRILTRAWGTARQDVVELPTDGGKLVSIEEAIPGFFRAMLTARRGEMVGVLPGRTEQHVKALAMAYDSERRDSKRIVRADFAQAVTRYIQTQPAPVRRDAEQAIGRWMVKAEPLSYVAA